jgi:hypothetical protein
MFGKVFRRTSGARSGVNFAHIVVISKSVVKRRKCLDDNFKNGRNVIKIYQASVYLGWSAHNPPNLTVSGG